MHYPQTQRRSVMLLVSVAQLRVVGDQSALRTGGPAAHEIGALWNQLLFVGGVATLLTCAALAYALFRRRKQDEQPSERNGVRAMIGAGLIVPAIVLGLVLVATIRGLAVVTPAAAEYRETPARGSIAIEISGKQYWWRVRYLDAQPAMQFETANELHIPVGVPVELRLRSEDVIHSFWVPGLHGKMDLIPGRTNFMRLAADHAGVWRGQCAEFCGLQHTMMAFTVVAETPEQFAQWRSRQQMGEAALDSTDTAALAGRASFMQAGCAACHSVRGSMATGNLGPDLTHIATRLTLAAGSFPNSAEQLRRWIADPQLHKPGSAMPSTALSASQVQSIAEYLSRLR